MPTSPAIADASLFLKLKDEDGTHKVKEAIVGGGPGGVAKLDSLLQQIEAGTLSPNAKIVIFEKSDDLALGMPYSPDINHPELRVNIAAVEPGIADDGEAFFKWLETKSEAELRAIGVDLKPGQNVSEASCYPRVVMGAYLKEYMDALLVKAQMLGVEVDVRTRTEATDLQLDGYGKKIVTSVHNGEITHERFDTVHLAIGHWFENDPTHTTAGPRVFKSPWPHVKYDTLPKGGEHGIIGMGPTGADAAIMLGLQNGTFTENPDGTLNYVSDAIAAGFKVTMTSKSGHLPQLRGPIDMAEYVTADDFEALKDPATGFIKLDDMFGLFRGDMKNRYPAFAASIPGLDTMTFVQFAQHLETAIDAKGDGKTVFLEHMKEGREAVEKHDAVLAAGGTQEDALKHAIPLQDVFINLYVYSEFHKFFSAEDKLEFNEKIKPIISKYAAPLPIEIATKLEAMAKAGALDIKKATDKARPYDDFPASTISITDARGQSNDITKHPAAIVQNMIRRGLITEESVPFADAAAARRAAATDRSLADRLVERDGKLEAKIGGISVTDDYVLRGQGGAPIEGVYYAGANCTRAFDPYSLIYVRDASKLIVDDARDTWNLRAERPSIFSPATDAPSRFDVRFGAFYKQHRAAYTARHIS